MPFLPSTVFAFSALGLFITVFFKHELKSGRFNPLIRDRLSMGQIEEHYPCD
jgi:hypothetical protein